MKAKKLSDYSKQFTEEQLKGIKEKLNNYDEEHTTSTISFEELAKPLHNFKHSDPVDHPMHYNQDNVECIDAMLPASDVDDDTNAQTEDPINPSYYKRDGYECIDIMETIFGKETVAAFCKCNVFKYTYRSPRKSSAESIAKAKWYLEKYMEIAPEFCEKWETHPNGLYEVSTLGNVRHVGATCNRKKVTLKNGYDTVMLCLKDKVYCCYVHRLVAETFLDNPNGYSEINHKNHIRTDNRLENLEWCSRKQNVQDAIGQHVWVYNTEGDFLDEFDSIRDCEKFFNFGHRSISKYIDTGKPRGNLLIYTHKL